MVIAWTIFLYILSPEGLVHALGIRNSYIILFLVSLLGGTSLFLPFPYYLFTISFGAAGLNPLLLGIIAGTGVLIGDLTSYFIAYEARSIAPKKYTKIIKRIYDWSEKKNPYIFPILAFLYASFIPLPDDIIMVPTGLMRYPLIRVIVPLTLGKIVFNTLLALSGLYGFSLLFT